MKLRWGGVDGCVQLKDKNWNENNSFIESVQVKRGADSLHYKGQLPVELGDTEKNET